MSDASVIVLVLVVAVAQLLLLLGIITAAVTFGMRRHAIWVAEGNLEKTLARRAKEREWSPDSAWAAERERVRRHETENRRPEL